MWFSPPIAPSPIAMAIPLAMGWLWKTNSLLLGWFSIWLINSPIDVISVVSTWFKRDHHPKKDGKCVQQSKKTPIMFIKKSVIPHEVMKIYESIHPTYFEILKHYQKTPILLWNMWISRDSKPSFINYSRPPSIFKQPQTWFEICLGVETMVCDIFCQ